MISAVRRSLVTLLAGYGICTFAACTGNVPQNFGMSGATEVGKTVTTAVTPQTGGTVKSAGGTASVTIPAGALAGNTNVTVTVKDKAAAPTPEKIISQVYDLGPSGTQFLQPVTLALAPTAAAPSGQKPVLAFLNAQQAWQVVPGSGLDANTNTVSGQVTHFTDFAVIFIATDGSGCATSPDPNAFCAPLVCDSVNNKCQSAPAAPTSFLVGGQVSGLNGGSVVLANNGIDLLTLGQDGNFDFATALGSGAPYLVTVAQAPAGEICTVNNGAGIINAADIASVQVICQTAYNVGGQVTGLGVANVTLQNGNTLVEVGAASPNFVVANLPTGSTYSVTVQAQPTGMNCQITNGSGVVGSSDINNIIVQCVVLSYPLGGHVTGLVANANVTLQNGSDTVSVGNGAYAFPTTLPSNASYAVSIVSPEGQSCTFAANVVGQGSMVAGPVNTVDVMCVPLTYPLGGSVVGLLDNTNVTITNGADVITVANGNFTLPTAVAYTTGFNVTVTPPIGQVCAPADPNVLAGIMPDAPVTNINLVCTLGSYPVGGTITGLVANTNVTLSNGADTIRPGPGPYAFPTPVTYLRPYAASIVMSPPFQSCDFADASTSSGTMTGDGVSNVDIVCQAQAFSLGGGVTGLAAGTTVTITQGNDTLTLGNGAFTFPTQVPYGNTYAIDVTSPDGQTCVFTPAGSGNAVMPAADYGNLALVCAATQYPLGGTITGLVSNTNITLGNGGDHISVSNGPYAFPTTLVAGADFAVSLTAPVAQTCTFTPGGSNAGTMVVGGFAGVNVTCVPASFMVGGTVSGLIGSASLGVDDGVDTINADNGAYTLPTPVAYGSDLVVTVNPPVGQSCLFGNGNTTFEATMGHSDLTNVNINCTAVTYSVGGFVTGLVGNAQVALQNGSDTLQATNGTFTFPTNVAFNSGYNVTLSSPAGQTCSFTGAHAGTMGASAITNIGVSCTSQTYTLGGQVSGLIAGTTVTVRQGGDILNLGNGNYALPTAVAFGATYDITVSQPTGQSCVFQDGNTFSAAAMGAGNVTHADITCGPSLYTLGGNVSGLVAGTQLTLQNGNDTIAVNNGIYTFPTKVAYNTAFSISAQSPGGETCTFTGSHSGTMGAANVTGVDLFCTGLPYPLGGRVSGLVNGTTVTLRNAGDSIAVGNGNFTFPTQVVFNTSYSASLVSPAGQTCTFSPPSVSIGTMPAAAVTGVNVACGPQTYTLGGTVSGLVANTNVSLQNGSDTIVVGNGAFTFDVGLPYSTAYNVSARTPAGQNCNFVGAHAGTMGAANVTSLVLACTPQTYALGGSVSGLVGSGTLTLQNGSDSVTVGNGSFSFPTAVAFGQRYAASLIAPAGQSCAFSPLDANAGIMPAGPVGTINAVCGPQTYSLSGTVSGLLQGTQLTLQNGNDNLVLGNGSYALPTGVAFGGDYNIAVTAPAGQTCAFSGAARAGTMGAGNIANINVACVPQQYAVGGTVQGLVGSTTLLLQQGGDSISVGNGNFSFPSTAAYGSTYNASLTSPSGQFCAFAPLGSNTGTVPAGDVTTIRVVCGAQTYSLGGSVSGLVANTNVVLVNGNDTLAVQNGLYTFPTALPYGNAYAVALTSPEGQSCAFVGTHAGTMGASNITNIGVNCTVLSYNLGGVVSGLVGSGTVTLQNGGDSISVSNGNYTFPTQLSYASHYLATLSSPSGQTCVFTPQGANNGVMPAGDVSGLNVSCGPQTYTLGGSVSGLVADGNVTLMNGSDTILAGNGAFTFPTGLAYNTGYAVTLTSPAGQTCSFTNNHAGTIGAANISNIGISCVPQTYSLGGQVTGLVGSGTVSLQNGGDSIAVGNGPYTFPTSIAYAGSYAATLTSPSGQTCVFSPVGAANGTMAAANVSSLNVSCGPQTYTLGGSVNGLVAGGNVTLQNGSDTLSVGNGAYTFPTGLAYNTGYNVTLVSPAGQSCNFTGTHVGTIGAANIANIGVSCVPQSFNLGGVVTGLVGNGTVGLQNGSDNFSVGNGAYTFPTEVAFDSNYSATLVSPSGQTCVFSPYGANQGTMPANDVNTLNVSCGPQTYTLGGSISGLVNNTQVTLQNGNDSLPAGNGAFTFPTGLAYNTGYNATIVSPVGQSCVFSSGHTGTMGAANISTLRVTCSTLSFVLGGTVSGLVGNSVVGLQNGADNMTVGNGDYTFATPVAYNANFIAQALSPPGQDCEFDPPGSNQGVMPGNDVTTLNLMCVPELYTVGGAVSGLVAGTQVGLENGNDFITVGSGPFSFPTPVAYAAAYSATLVSPTGQSCAFNGSHAGNVGAGNVTTIAVACTPISYALGGSVSGLVAGGQVSLVNGSDAVMAGNGNYTFPTAVPFGGTYAAQLTSPAGQTCSFSPTNANAGTMPANAVTGVNVICGSQTYTVGGAVSGLLSGTQVTLQSGSDSITVGNGAYTFPTALLYSAAYNVTITSPDGQSCSFNGVASGTVGAANITDIDLTCTTDTYAVGGTVSGLIGQAQLQLQNGGDSILVGNGDYSFPTQVAYQNTFAAQLTAPAGHACGFTPADSNTGTVPAGNVTSVDVTCVAQSYNLGGAVSGLVAGGEVTLQNGGDSIQVGNGNYVFPTAVAYNSGYGVSVTAPDGQSCVITGTGTGTMPAGDLESINVSCSASGFYVGGQVSGLAGGAQVALQNGADAIQVGNGNFSFPTPVAYQSTYAASLTAPAGHTCVFSPTDANSGTMPASSITTVQVVCTPGAYNLGGTVSGLVGSAQVTLQNGDDNVQVGNGSFSFPTAVIYDANYLATLTAPAGQSCTFSPAGSNAGVMPASDVTTLAVVCTAQTFALGGTVSGLSDGTQVTLQNGPDTLQAANGTYTFPTALAFGAGYAASLTSPQGQSCSYAGNASGTMGSADVTNLDVACVPLTYTVGGAVSGLVGTAQVTLQNGADSLSVGNGNYTFPTSIAFQSTYGATLTAPVGQSCAFSPDGVQSGTMQSGDVTNVNVVCGSQSFTLGGTVSGIVADGQVTLQNGNDTLTVGNGGYTFPTSLVYQAAFQATLTSPAGQSCSFQAAADGTMGTGNITDLDVSCTPQTYALGGTVSGLAGSTQVTLQNGNDSVVSGNGPYTFPTAITYADAYAATLTSPAGQTCTFQSAASGAMGAGDVTDLDVTCTPQTYNLGGTVSGLAGGSDITLQSGRDTISVSNGDYTFPTPVAYNTAYSVTITAPAGQSCSFDPVGTDSGTMPAGDVTNVNISCVGQTFTVGGSVSGLDQGAQVVLGNGNDTITVTDNTVFTFPTALADAAAYSVSVVTAPQNQTCSVTNGQGSVAGADVADVAVSCTDTTAPGPGLNFTTAQSAVTVIGQLDFASNGDGVDDSTLSNPLGAVFAAPNGDIYLSDTEHLRIVGYHLGVPADPGTPFDFEIGQPDLFTRHDWTTPDADKYYPRTITGNADVLVATDGFDNRVMILQTFPETTVGADVVLGQPDFVSNATACAQDGLNGPRGASATGGGQLLVADALNNRVLIWNSIPTVDGQGADVVLGQPDFVTCDAPGNNASGPDTLTGPWDVWSDGTHVLVADTFANRVLVWNTFPSANGQNADAVIGQPDMSTNTAGPLNAGLGSPSGVTTDGVSIFVSEYDNMRVSVWSGVPWQSGTPSLTAVLGQPDVNTAACGNTPSDNSMCQAGGVSIIGTQLLVADTVNNRFMVFAGQ